MEWLLFEGVSWNPDAAIGLSQEQFVEKGLREGQYKSFSETDQRILLQQVYEMLCSANNQI